MKRLNIFRHVSSRYVCSLASDSLPLPVSVGGQAAKEGTSFAKIENSGVGRSAAVSSIKRRHDHCYRKRGERKERTGSRLNARGFLLQGKTKTNLDKTLDGKKLGCRKLRHERC